jgi:N-acetylglucosamine kinase-like BadF-type ATPase
LTAALGIDLGGTWLRAEACGERGRSLGRLRLPAVPWRRLPETMPALLRRLRLPALDRLTVGARGVWTPRDRAEARKRLRAFAASVRVVSDLELGRAAAFAGGPGVLVVAGTGSAAFAMDEAGRQARAGGLGPLLGDEGSGFWLGRAALRHEGLRRRLGLDPLAFAHAPDPVRAVAALAPRVLRLAASRPGPAAARALRDEAAEHLADNACRAARGLLFQGPVPLSWTGGLLDDSSLMRRFLRALSRRPTRFSPAPPRLKAERAAAVLEPGLFCRITR